MSQRGQVARRPDSAEPDGVEFLDPVALEARLVEARARRAEVMARRAAGEPVVGRPRPFGDRTRIEAPRQGPTLEGLQAHAARVATVVPSAKTMPASVEPAFDLTTPGPARATPWFTKPIALVLGLATGALGTTAALHLLPSPWGSGISDVAPAVSAGDSASRFEPAVRPHALGRLPSPDPSVRSPLTVLAAAPMPEPTNPTTGPVGDTTIAWITSSAPSIDALSPEGTRAPAPVVPVANASSVSPPGVALPEGLAALAPLEGSPVSPSVDSSVVLQIGAPRPAFVATVPAPSATSLAGASIAQPADLAQRTDLQDALELGVRVAALPSPAGSFIALARLMPVAFTTLPPLPGGAGTLPFSAPGVLLDGPSGEAVPAVANVAPRLWPFVRFADGLPADRRGMTPLLAAWNAVSAEAFGYPLAIALDEPTRKAPPPKATTRATDTSAERARRASAAAAAKAKALERKILERTVESMLRDRLRGN